MTAEETQQTGAGPYLRLTLDLRLEDEPVAGVVSDGRSREPFFGWSGLTRAIELALDAHRPTARGEMPGAGGAG